MTGIFQLFLLVSATVASEPSCPACSKYDYEEKLLERMIRVQFAYEKLDEKMEQNLNKIEQEKARLHKIVDDLKDQQEQAGRRLASLMQEVERNQSSTLDMVVANSNNTLEQIRAAFNNIKVSATLASEPSCPACSKYDYEEKMLERMIRMDFAFEKLDEKLEQNLSKIKEEKAHLHELIVDDLTDQQKPAERILVSFMDEVERNQSSTLEMAVANSNNTLE
ncbi:hypothetical protein MAR_003732 [Mya arenaria]|uniref:Uncharacterized protein n=1 Tax=Mya arenaria TaxID=6604 RepID=A0ABY7G9E8_MYAAR|nr:hypothetical protein MAR_003732 [Mya arenaria]